MRASPASQDRAGRASPEPASGLGHSATIADAGRAYRFSELVGIALRAFERPASDFIAVSANIKYLQRQRAIPHYATGRGQPAQYSREDVLRALFGLELHSIGLTPQQISPILEAHWHALSAAAERNGRAFVRLPTAAGRSIMLRIFAGTLAQAIEARSGETRSELEGFDPKGESAAPQGCAQ